MSTQEKRERMLSLVADWRGSGLTQKAFGVLHGIKVATLSYWVARAKEQQAGTQGFIAVDFGPSKKNDQIEIIYPTFRLFKS